MRIKLKYVLTCMSFLLFISVAYSQQKVRTVDEDTYRKTNEPLKVHYVLNNHALLRNRMSGGPDWIKQLSLNVTNISEKSITYFYIQLIIEKQDSMKYSAVVIMTFPFVSEPILDASGKPTGEYKKQILRPGESIKVRPPEDQLGILDKIRDKDGVSDISSVSLEIRYVHFEDGTRWELGGDYKEDPNNPGKWIRTNMSPDLTCPNVSQRIRSWLKEFRAFNTERFSPSLT